MVEHLYKEWTETLEAIEAVDAIKVTESEFLYKRRDFGNLWLIDWWLEGLLAKVAMDARRTNGID